MNKTVKVGKGMQRGYEYYGYREILKEICENEGLDLKIVYKLLSKEHMSAAFLERIIYTYKNIFERYGLKTEDFIEYLNNNSVLVNMTNNSLENNLPLFDYAGLLDEVVFEDVHVLQKNYNSNDLYAVIRWMRDISDSSSPKLTVDQIKNHMRHLSYNQIQYLRQKYPYTKFVKENINSLFEFKTFKDRKPNKFLETLLEKFRILFESYGFGPEEYEEYLKENNIIFDINLRTLRFNLALFDYVGLLEEVIFNFPYVLAKNYEPEDLYAVIEHIKNKTNSKIGDISVPEIEYYFNDLTKLDLKDLRQMYPYTLGTAGRISLKHDALIKARLNENKAYTLKTQRAN